MYIIVSNKVFKNIAQAIIMAAFIGFNSNNLAACNLNTKPSVAEIKASQNRVNLTARQVYAPGTANPDISNILRSKSKQLYKKLLPIYQLHKASKKSEARAAFDKVLKNIGLGDNKNFDSDSLYKLITEPGSDHFIGYSALTTMFLILSFTTAFYAMLESNLIPDNVLINPTDPTVIFSIILSVVFSGIVTFLTNNQIINFYNLTLNIFKGNLKCIDKRILHHLIHDEEFRIEFETNLHFSFKKNLDDWSNTLNELATELKVSSIVEAINILCSGKPSEGSLTPSTSRIIHD